MTNEAFDRYLEARRAEMCRANDPDNGFGVSEPLTPAEATRFGRCRNCTWWNHIYSKKSRKRSCSNHMSENVRSFMRGKDGCTAHWSKGVPFVKDAAPNADNA